MESTFNMSYFNSRSANKRILPLLGLLLIFFVACKKKTSQPEPVYEVNQEYNLQNISYGNDNQQKMDIYLPANRTAATTKVFVLIHGGAWSAGDKSDFTYMMNSLKTYYPNHAIINLNYRLASQTSPAYPKQINDIQAALAEIGLAKYNVSQQFFLFGNSAGGHLSLLYAYGFDSNHRVKGICNTVGPADFTDPNYLNNPSYSYYYPVLVGQSNPIPMSLIRQVSPACRVTSSAPPTLSFYGDQDPLVPATQMGRLHDSLNAHGVYNEATMYQGAGHGNWNPTQSQDCIAKMALFINTYFPQ